VLVAVFDEQPLFAVAGNPRAPAGLDQGEASAQLPALEDHVDFTLLKLLVGRDAALRLVCTFIPDHHRSRAILALGNHPLEIGVLDRMVLRPYGEPLVRRTHGRPFGYCPRYQNAVDRQPKIIMQSTRVMFLHDKETAAVPAPNTPRRLGRLTKLPLPAVFFERHSASRVSPSRY
jgi:hypothetical protein